MHWPVQRSQTRTVRSKEPLATRFSDRNASAFTSAVCPSRDPTHLTSAEGSRQRTMMRYFSNWLMLSKIDFRLAVFLQQKTYFVHVNESIAWKYSTKHFFFTAMNSVGNQSSGTKNCTDAWGNSFRGISKFRTTLISQFTMLPLGSILAEEGPGTCFVSTVYLGAAHVNYPYARSFSIKLGKQRVRINHAHFCVLD
jgi:hypothetical protein